MGAFDYIDPVTVKPTPGNAVVEVVEILGGTTESGLFIPGTTQDHMGKDTCYVKILSVGPAPRTAHYRPSKTSSLTVRPSKSGKPWPKEVMDAFQPGDILVLPRDVPLVFIWEERRFAVIHLHEAILHIPEASFDAQKFEFVPWSPPDIEGDNVQTVPIDPAHGG